MTVDIYTVHTIILYICIELVSKHRQYNLFLYTYIRCIYKKDLFNLSPIIMIMTNVTIV